MSMSFITHGSQMVVRCGIGLEHPLTGRHRDLSLEDLTQVTTGTAVAPPDVGEVITAFVTPKI